MNITPTQSCIIVSALVGGLWLPYVQAQPQTVDATADIQTLKGEVDIDKALRQTSEWFDEIEDRRSESLHSENLHSRGQHEEKIKEVKRLLHVVEQQNPSHPQLSYLLGRQYAQNGRYHRAIEHLRQFISTPVGRNQWRAYRLLGNLFVGEFPQLANSYYAKSAVLNPNEPSVMFGLSVCAFKLGNVSKAISLAHDTVATDGGYRIRYLAHLATLQHTQQAWGEALKSAESALTIATELVQRGRGQVAPLKEIEEQYRLVISILLDRARIPDEGQLDALLQLVKRKRALADVLHKLSIHTILETIEPNLATPLSDTPASLLETYAEVLVEVDQETNAIAVLEALLKKTPNNPAVQDWLVRLKTEFPSSDQPVEIPVTRNN